MMALIHETTAGPMDDNRRSNCQTLQHALQKACHAATDAWANGELTSQDQEVLMMLDNTLGATMSVLRQLLADLTWGRNT